MKKFCLSVMVMMILMISLSYGLGLGVMIGEPTGLSFKSWYGDRTAIAGGLAWSFSNYDGRNGYLHVHADYLIHNNNLIQAGSTTLPFYYGLGVRVGLGNDLRLGVRIPIGIECFFADRKFDAFLEIVPVLDLLPGTGFGINGAIGLRYNF